MLDQKDLRIIDVRIEAQCPDGHIPGAVLLDYSKLVRKSGLTEGLLPSREKISDLFSDIGLESNHFVVAYDDGSGVDAARLLWTLDAVGHQNYALLNGGFATWDEAELDIVNEPTMPERGNYPVNSFNDAVVALDYVLDSIGKPDVCLVDTRTIAEFNGDDVRAEKAGHIPSAIHFDWSSAVDLYADGVLHDSTKIRDQLESLGITKNKEIIVYCQSNRRSAHTFIVLKWLGYPRIKAYAGSWSEWGNAAQTPVNR